MGSLEGRVAFVTGASRGIGHATVRHFSEAGWRVLTVSRNAIDPACPWAGGSADHIQLDLSDLASLEEGARRIRERLPGGRLDAMVNNAGISPKAPAGRRLGILECDAATWLHVFSVNLFSSALLARLLFAELKAAGGAIVNVTSIAGTRVHPFAGPAYAASKAALAALTREMAHEFAPHGVRCNAIAPGEIDTAILSPGTDSIVRTQIPMRRLGRPEEVAHTILWLCSDASSYVNGTEVEVNGGQHV